MSDLQLHLANLLGQIFKLEVQPEELRSPGLSKDAQALLNNNPNAYGQILIHLLDGIPVHLTAKKLKQPTDLVRFIARIHPEIRLATQNHTIANLEESLHHFSDRLAKEAHLIPPRDIPKAINSTTEQLALLTGHATHRLEINNVPSRDKLLKLYNELHDKDQK